MIEQLPSHPDRLVITVVAPQLSAQQLFDAFTTPELLARWWPPQSEIDARVGGAYHLAWPEQDWHLRGVYTELRPGERLAFRWHWDHEPEKPPRSVEISFTPEGTGTRLTLTHGYYSDEDAEERMGHLDGWLYFLPLLANLEPDVGE